ncbi:MAG: hypothetical protein J1F11_02715 [Oscillospiraceae bacterium]|nr:hypothetical protein [Oscillospiraceae bacterium]
MIYKEKINELLSNHLKPHLSEYDFKQFRSSRQFKRVFDNGYWHFEIIVNSSQKYNCDFLTYNLRYYLDDTEAIVRRIAGNMYRKGYMTGGCQLGNLMSPGVHYESYIDPAAIIEDVAYDVIYHFDKYAVPLINKYTSASDFYKGVTDNKEIAFSLNNKFHRSAINILAGNYSEAIKILSEMPEGHFGSPTKSECIIIANKIIEELSNDIDKKQ